MIHPKYKQFLTTHSIVPQILNINPNKIIHTTNLILSLSLSLSLSRVHPQPPLETTTTTSMPTTQNYHKPKATIPPKSNQPPLVSQNQSNPQPKS